MRTLRLSLAGTVFIALLAVPAATFAQSDVEDPMAPAYFTGTIDDSGGSLLSEGTWSDLDGVLEGRGFKFGPDAIETSDPRFSGDLYATWNQDEYLAFSDGEFYLQSALFELVTPEGMWVGPSTDIGSTEGAFDIDTAILTGSGAYEGLTAYAHFSWGDDPKAVRGVIFPGQMPPQPDPIETPTD